MMSAVNHDFHDRRQIGCGRNFLARAALHQKFDRDVDERETPDQLDVGVGQQRRDDEGEGEEQQRRRAGANQDAPRPSRWRQSAARQRDDHGGIAGEYGVDQGDLRYADPEPGPAEAAENRRKGSAPEGRIEV